MSTILSQLSIIFSNNKRITVNANYINNGNLFLSPELEKALPVDTNNLEFVGTIPFGADCVILRPEKIIGKSSIQDAIRLIEQSQNPSEKTLKSIQAAVVAKMAEVKNGK